MRAPTCFPDVGRFKATVMMSVVAVLAAAVLLTGSSPSTSAQTCPDGSQPTAMPGSSPVCTSVVGAPLATPTPAPTVGPLDTLLLAVGGAVAGTLQAACHDACVPPTPQPTVPTSGSGVGGGNPALANPTAAVAAPTAAPPSVAARAVENGWRNQPPTSATAKMTCPAAGQWLLLYWGSSDVETAIATSAAGCPAADRIWVSRGGKWLGFSAGLPAASDSWQTLSGEAHFIHGG
jgi:hypothetical protein